MTSEATNIEFLTAAERLTENFRDYAQAEVIPIIAARYAKLGLVDHAIELAETIPDPFTRDNTLTEIAAESLSTGTSDYANALLEMIDDPGIRSVAIEEIAVKYAELGDVDTSLELAKELDDPDPTLRRIALVDPAFSPRAVEIALSITAADLRASTLGQLVTLANRADRKSEAAELLDECLRSAEEIEFSEHRTEALIGIASLYEDIGDTDRALELLSQAFELCQDFEGLPPAGLSASFPRGEVLTQLVQSFARLGDFEKADRAAEEIEDPFQFAHASTKEAIEYFRVGRIDQALTLLSEARELAVEEPAYGAQGLAIKDSLMAELAVGFSILGHLEKSLEITKNLSSESQRSVALELVGKECARMGNSHGIFEVGQAITNSVSSAAYWLAITDVLRESADTDLVHQTLCKATESATRIQDNYENAMSLIEAAYRFALLNNSAKASELFKLALTTINRVEQFDKRSLLLLRLDQQFRELERVPWVEDILAAFTQLNTDLR
jgi:tetratricopeptide (TPR) repeat protein